ncbi:NfeD family protein [Bacillus mexicanus]|uniref:NfeD family protein n=1 Tax=Bacillus mexicanus TaxID=2834415 RepID=UPI003D1D8397
MTLLYILFGDVLEGAGDVLINPVLILAFLTFLATGGLLLEKYTELNSWIILAISASIALIIDILLNIFVLVPFKNTEHSLTVKKESLVGRTATVITAIPVDGFGEVIIQSKTGKIAKAAKSENGEIITNGTSVTITNTENSGYVVVVPSKD